MDSSEARAHLNYLLTLGLRREEAFGPMALSFIKEEAFESAGLLPEEQFSLIMATVQALAEEPKRYNMKLEMLKRAADLLDKTSFDVDGAIYQSYKFASLVSILSKNCCMSP